MAPASIRVANSTPNPTASPPAPMAAAQIAHTAASSQVRRCRSAITPMGIAPIAPQMAMQNGISPRSWSEVPN